MLRQFQLRNLREMIRAGCSRIYYKVLSRLISGVYVCFPISQDDLVPQMASFSQF